MTTRMVRRTECVWLDDDIDVGTMLYHDNTKAQITISAGNTFIYVMYDENTPPSFQFPTNALEVYGVTKTT